MVREPLVHRNDIPGEPRAYRRRDATSMVWRGLRADDVGMKPGKVAGGLLNQDRGRWRGPSNHGHPAAPDLELLHECWLARLPPAKIAVMSQIEFQLSTHC